MRVQGWDPVMLICQIISLQTLHYLTLSLLIPPILQALSNPVLLAYSGGPTTVSHILDWREMAARPTVSSSNFHGLLDLTSDGWQKLHGAWSGGKQIGEVVESETSGSEGSLDHHSPSSEDHSKAPAEDLDKWDMGVDEGRGWLLGFIWLVACAVDIAPLYYLIRRPTYILDFCLTLNFVHLILTTYHAKAFPTSIFYWVVQGLGALLMIVVAEQLCVKREMRTDLEISFKPVATDEAGEEIEMNRV